MAETGIRFKWIVNEKPNESDVRTEQISRGYPPSTYGEPSLINIKHLKDVGKFQATWYCPGVVV